MIKATTACPDLKQGMELIQENMRLKRELEEVKARLAALERFLISDCAETQEHERAEAYRAELYEVRHRWAAAESRNRRSYAKALKSIDF